MLATHHHNHHPTKIEKMLGFIKAYFVTAFALIENGNLGMKLGSSVLLAITASPVLWVMGIMKDKVIKDIAFANILLLLLFIDLICGVWKHLKNSTFDWKRLYMGFIEKVGVSFLGMIVFNALGSIQEWDKLQTVRDYITLVGKLINLVYVGGSAFNSMYVITGGRFPPIGWMNRMKKFNTTASIEDLKNAPSVDNDKKL